MPTTPRGIEPQPQSRRGGSSRAGASAAAGSSSCSSPRFRPENMVHQMMRMNTTPAARASSKIRPMKNGLQWLVGLAIVATLAACSTGTRQPEWTSQTSPASTPPSRDLGPLTGSLAHPKSRWVPVAWSELPGFNDDALHEGWIAMITNCARPNAAFAPLCREVRQLSLAESDEQREWMMQRLQPYRVEAYTGPTDGKLTSYYEPVFEATRRPTATNIYPLYQTPAGLVPKRPWYTRQEIDTLPQA